MDGLLTSEMTGHEIKTTRKTPTSSIWLMYDKPFIHTGTRKQNSATRRRWVAQRKRNYDETTQVANRRSLVSKTCSTLNKRKDFTQHISAAVLSPKLLINSINRVNPHYFIRQALVNKVMLGSVKWNTAYNQHNAIFL